MTLDTFRCICMHHGLTLDEGYALYMMYRKGVAGIPPGISQDSLLKMIGKKLLSNGVLSYELKEEFRIAEMEFGDGHKYTETLEINEKMVRITQPVRRRELAIIPILDTMIRGLKKILITEKIEKTRLHQDLFQKAILYFNNDRQLAEYYMIWYYLWPTTGDKNEPWEQLFVTKYSNVSLRNSTDNKLRDFKDTARKEDIRIFILSTYLFIKSGIKADGNCFIQKYENFKKVKSECFMFAIDLIEELKENLMDVFHRDFMINGRKQKFSNSATGILV